VGWYYARDAREGGRQRWEERKLGVRVCVPLLVARGVGASDGGSLVDVDPVLGAATLLALLGLPAAAEGLGVNADAGGVVLVLSGREGGREGGR